MSGRRATRKRRSELALDQFEKALRALHRQELDRARTAFESIVGAYPDEIEIVERARTYLAVCDNRRPRK